MSAKHRTVNTGAEPIAQLENVRLFIELLEKMMNRAAHLPGFGVFCGPSGLGKTQSAVHGAMLYNAAHIECGQSWNATTLVDEILFELTATYIKGTVAKKMKMIVEALAADTRPLIIDEADFLVKRSMIDLVREMSDKAGAPIILIGEELLPKKMQPFERAYNRVLKWQFAQPCDVEGAALLAGLYVPELEIEPPLLAHLVDSTRGVTRLICDNIDAIREHAVLHSLSRIGLKDWDATTTYSGAAPVRPRAHGRAA